MHKIKCICSLFTFLLCGATAFAQSHSATVSWTPAQQPSGITVSNWNVLRGTGSGGPYTQVGTAPAGTTSYTDSTVSSGDNYYYVVQAVDSAGATSADSTAAEASIPTSAAPLAVSTSSLPAATVGASYSATINASGGVAPYTWSGTGADGLTFSATGLLSGTPSQAGSFRQVVTVKDSGGNTASASLALSVAASPAPAAPTLSLRNSGLRFGDDLSWTPNSEPSGVTVASWSVLRSTDGTTYSPISSIAAGTTTYRDTNVTVGETYYYVVQAVSITGLTSPYSNAVESTITRIGTRRE